MIYVVIPILVCVLLLTLSGLAAINYAVDVIKSRKLHILMAYFLLLAAYALYKGWL